MFSSRRRAARRFTADHFIGENFLHTCVGLTEACVRVFVFGLVCGEGKGGGGRGKREGGVGWMRGIMEPRLKTSVLLLC